MSAVEESVLEAIRIRITKIFPAQIRTCVEQLTDEQIWWRPNEKSNSIGNIVVHLSGSLNHYLNVLVGGIEYHRDREAEFAERRHIPRAELLALFNDMIANAEKTLAPVDVARLSSPSPEPKMYTLLVDDLFAICVHVANHAGQIVWITKMLADGAIDDVWIRTHKELGGWPARQRRQPAP
ncbi:MAG: DUF1572 family protein [Thermoanaerobaculia bacterium]